MKHSISLVLVVLAVLLLSACSAKIGTGVNLNPASEHNTEVIGAVTDGYGS